MRPLAAFACALALLAGLSGCGRDCTEIGGVDGVVVEVPEALYVATGRLVVEICDARGCAESEDELTEPVGEVSRERSVVTEFADLGRDFAPGTVSVSVVLRDSRDSIVARRQQDIELRRFYPNGESCDGDGYVSGGLLLRVSDAR